ncbi:MAG: hypothetical protein CLLPBCKN_006867 [Chroococcidiopsis cubana SAG 39.79]|uniref:Phage tail protein n=1 Tax=Chroococcidiopsis cubana SAG 39.79 TaxID=388085 RepID=A0AB37UIM1_9CYAN|nr:phage tail protein [Chroococcidiopsis cubana]MDZ4877432.1 hypothetical protein [Chroococcidiopsis cubana SAG 39.79]PSB61912.1 phage tail protein [Chroococcidiopsis cubana CCALA 043]RUT11230.1 phage tail protein [Chroococcidiopsis cubana SAG 39.79]
MPPSVGSFENYVTTNRFWIEIDNDTKARFSECHGLGVSIKKDIYFEGGLNDQQRVFLGHAEFSNITLKRGTTDCPAFFEWLGAAFERKNTRSDANIALFNQAGEVMISWTLIGSAPIDWKIAPLQADGNSVVIEELIIAIEGLKIGKTSTGAMSGERNPLGFYGYSGWKQE